MDFETFIADLYESEDVGVFIRLPGGAHFNYPGGEIGHASVGKNSCDIMFFDGTVVTIPKQSVILLKKEEDHYLLRLNYGAEWIINY